MEPTTVTAWAAGVSAFATSISAVIAFLLWWVTRKYTAETEAIAEANRRMADANDRMVRESQETVREMRREREHARHERSAGAAQRMTAATMKLMLDWHRAVDDPKNVVWGFTDERPRGERLLADDKRARALSAWQTAYATERADIESAVVIEDLDRFGRIVETALTDWDAISLLDEDGEPLPESRRRPDYRGYRLAWCQRRLVDTLDAHRRENTRLECWQPPDPGAFLSLPPGATEQDFV